MDLKMNRISKLQVSLGFIASLVFMLILWYKDNAPALSQSEVANYMAQIKAQNNNPGRHDLKALESFLTNDDGNAFYTVNLYQYALKAQYSDETLNTISGKAAFELFSQTMIRLLAKQGSHPIFASDWSHSLTSSWDRIVIVRYRSRRDIAELFISPEFTKASTHKWAAIKKNERLIVQALHIPNLFPFLIISFILIIFIMVKGFKIHKITG